MDGAVGVGVILLVSLRNLDIEFESFLTPDLHTDFLMLVHIMSSLFGAQPPPPSPHRCEVNFGQRIHYASQFYLWSSPPGFPRIARKPEIQHKFLRSSSRNCLFTSQTRRTSVKCRESSQS